MDFSMQEALRRGNALRALLRQGRLQHRDVFEQLVALTAVSQDWVNELPTPQVRPFVDELCSRARSDMPELVEQISTGDLPANNWHAPLAPLAAQLRPGFVENET
jgi:F0F1-type ATP synthase alpha subunit